MTEKSQDYQKYQFTLQKILIVKKQITALETQLQEIKAGKFYKLWQLFRRIKK